MRRIISFLILCIIGIGIYFACAVGIRNYRENVLGDAITKDDLASVRQIIPRSISVNYRFGNRATPLHAAVYNGQADITQYLLSIGADINAVDNDGNTPVLLSVRKQAKQDILPILLRYHPNLSISYGGKGRTALAISFIKGNYKSAELLLNAGESASEKYKNGVTILMMAVEKDDLIAARMLIKHHADISASTTKGVTATDIAIRKNDSKMIGLLLINNPKVFDTQNGKQHKMHL